MLEELFDAVMLIAQDATGTSLLPSPSLLSSFSSTGSLVNKRSSSSNINLTDRSEVALTEWWRCGQYSRLCSGTLLTSTSFLPCHSPLRSRYTNWSCAGASPQRSRIMNWMTLKAGSTIFNEFARHNRRDNETSLTNAIFSLLGAARTWFLNHEEDLGDWDRFCAHF